MTDLRGNADSFRRSNEQDRFQTSIVVDTCTNTHKSFAVVRDGVEALVAGDDKVIASVQEQIAGRFRRADVA